VLPPTSDVLQDKPAAGCRCCRHKRPPVQQIICTAAADSCGCEQSPVDADVSVTSNSVRELSKDLFVAVIECPVWDALLVDLHDGQGRHLKLSGLNQGMSRLQVSTVVLRL